MTAAGRNFDRSLKIIYMLALLLTGLGYLAILPVFEGFDENAHYSSIRQIANTGTLPVYGASFLDKETENYQGPIAYNSLAPPFDLGMVYAKFFEHPDWIKQYGPAYRQRTEPTPYRAGKGMNWQAQHPPLYYILLAPVEKAAEHLPFVTRIFVLRLVSFALALAGTALGLFATMRRDVPLRDNPATLGFLLYPLVLPMFFPEFTRIGNDALCLFFVGAAAYIFAQILRDEHQWKWPLALGIVLGLGLLTKAFFLPITAALALFLILRTWCEKNDPAVRSRRRKNIPLVFLPALMIGGGWYAYKLIAFGELTGSDDAIRLAHQGGLLINLKHNFSLYGLVRGLTVTLVSFSWAGTWSLTRLPPLLHMPLLGLAAWIFGTFAVELKKRPLAHEAWLPVWLFLMFGGGFLYHVVISVALNGNGNTPGWYLHILLPWLAPALGAGASTLLQNARSRPLLIGLLAYAVLFQMMAIWAQIALFTGCAVKGDNKYYVFPNHAFCLDQFSLMMDHLAVLGSPSLAACGFLGGIVSAIWLLIKIQNKAIGPVS